MLLRLFEEEGYGGGVLKDGSGCCCGGAGYCDGVRFSGEGFGVGGVDAVSAAVGQHESCAEEGQGQEFGRFAWARREESQWAEEESPEDGPSFCGGIVCDGVGSGDRESECGVGGTGRNDGWVEGGRGQVGKAGGSEGDRTRKI